MGNDEWLEAVDENDNVVGRVLRSQAHRSKILHRAVHVLLFEQGGRVILQQRDNLKSINPARWTSTISGHVASDQGYDSTADQEMRAVLVYEFYLPIWVHHLPLFRLGSPLIAAATVRVPEPSTMLVLISGLVGLIGFRRRFRK